MSKDDAKKDSKKMLEDEFDKQLVMQVNDLKNILYDTKDNDGVEK